MLGTLRKRRRWALWVKHTRLCIGVFARNHGPALSFEPFRMLLPALYLTDSVHDCVHYFCKEETLQLFLLPDQLGNWNGQVTNCFLPVISCYASSRSLLKNSLSSSDSTCQCWKRLLVSSCDVQLQVTREYVVLEFVSSKCPVTVVRLVTVNHG